MSAVVAIGDPRRVTGFALSGVLVLPTADARSAQAAWDALPADTALVIFSPDAREHLDHRLAERPELLWTVLGE
jgi:vacuolar-type H+-ATPase subunit F/Vma7